MSDRDDSFTDMDDHELSDERIERLIAGTETPEGFEGVAAEFATLRSLRSGVRRVPVSASLGEFVSTPSSTLETDEDLVLVPLSGAVSPPPPRRHRMLAGTAAARFAIAGAVAVVGVTGAHATGLVDVPLLPDEGDPVELVSAVQTGGGGDTPDTPGPADTADPVADTPTQPEDDADTTEGDDSQPDLDHPEFDGKVNIVVGDASFEITVDTTGGDVRIQVDVEGVSAECEAAIEALEDLTDLDALDAAGDPIEQACADDFANFTPEFGDLDFDADGVFGGFFGHSFGQCDLGSEPGEEPTDKTLDELLESCLPDGIEIFGDIGGFGHFRDHFGSGAPDFSELDDLLEELDLGELEGLLEGQDLSQLRELFGDLDLSQLGNGESGDLEALIDQFLGDLEPNESGS